MTIKATLGSGDEQPSARSTYAIGTQPCPSCGKRACGGECGAAGLDRTPPLTDDDASWAAANPHSGWQTHRKMADIAESERTGKPYW